MEVTLKSFPKVNIGLYIGNVRPDGFHSLISIFHKIDCVHDTVSVSWKPGFPGNGCSVRVCGLEGLAPEKENTCYTSCLRYMQSAGLGGSVEISVEKKIPVLAGLGGGSSNAAVVLLALQELTGNALPPDKLTNIALMTGSDVPFFIKGCKAAVVSGRGEHVLPVSARRDLSFRLVEPDQSPTVQKNGTGTAYSMLDRLGTRSSLPKASELVDMYCKPVSEWSFENDFEKLYTRPNPVSLTINPNHQKLYLTGAGSMWYTVTDRT